MVLINIIMHIIIIYNTTKLFINVFSNSGPAAVRVGPVTKITNFEIFFRNFGILIIYNHQFLNAVYVISIMLLSYF